MYRAICWGTLNFGDQLEDQNVWEANISRQAMDVWRNTEERSRNHCCTGKFNKYYIFWVCVSLALVTQHAKSNVPYYIVICGLSCCTPFFHIVTKGMIFGKKLPNINVCLDFLYFFCKISHCRDNFYKYHIYIYIYIYIERERERESLRWSRGSVLAFGTQVRSFKPGRSLRIFRAKKSSTRLPSEGK
jgi:hypothetical protein